MKLAFQLWPAKSEITAAASHDRRIALLHGMGGTGALWRSIAASLENHYQLMAFDQRGHGKSRFAQTSGGRDAAQQDYTPLHYGQDVIETIEAENFYPTWLIGHSMGVRTACAAAHLRPDWIKGLILIDLGFYGPAGGGLGEGLATFLRVLPERFASREEARAFMTERCPDPSIAQYLMAVSQRAPDGSVTFPFDHGGLIRTIEAAAHVSVRSWVEELGRAGKPILVLRGARSMVWSHEEYEEERKRFAPYPSIVFKEFEGAGHGLPFEQRQRFVSEVEAFIAGSDAQ
jgi:pimeloyl-ACP methyl ester carboxylesterase